MPISRTVLIGLLALAGCGSEPDPFAADAGVAEAQGRVACRIGDAADFAEACALERTSAPEGLVLTVRHPDGGFRRLLVTTDGRGVIAADGAEPARVTVAGDGLIEVAIGADAYRLPATVKPQ